MLRSADVPPGAEDLDEPASESSGNSGKPDFTSFASKAGGVICEAADDVSSDFTFQLSLFVKLDSSRKPESMLPIFLSAWLPSLEAPGLDKLSSIPGKRSLELTLAGTTPFFEMCLAWFCNPEELTAPLSCSLVASVTLGNLKTLLLEDLEPAYAEINADSNRISRNAEHFPIYLLHLYKYKYKCLTFSNQCLSQKSIDLQTRKMQIEII